MRDFLVEASLFVFGIALLLGFAYSIVQLAQENEDIREKQRAACIAAGGKYAESQRVNARPHSDYCIK